MLAQVAKSVLSEDHYKRKHLHRPGREISSGQEELRRTKVGRCHARATVVATELIRSGWLDLAAGLGCAATETPQSYPKS